MDAATLTVIVTLATGQTTTMTRDFASMKGCEALAAAFRDTGGVTGRKVEVSCTGAASVVVRESVHGSAQ